MFSPGFRLFMGLSGFAFVAAFFYGVVSGDGGGADYLGFLDAESWVGALSLGWKGGVGDHVGYVILIMLSVVAGGLALMLVAFRDADAESVAELNGGELPPAQGPTTTNYWPIVGAFGAGVTIIGLSTHIAFFYVGILVLGAVAFEWMMSAWADRATGDPAANVELRNRIMKPVEIPILGAVGIAVLVLSASRLFLAVSEAWAVWSAVGLSAVIFIGALALALADNLNKNVVAAVLAIGAVGMLTAGVISASVGERDIEKHEHHDSAEEGALAW